jgi:hypothetical protein
MRVAITEQDLYDISKGGYPNVMADDGQEVNLGPLDFTGRQLQTLRAGGEVTVDLGDVEVHVEVTATTLEPPRGLLYLISVEGGIEPTVHGPYRSERERTATGRQLHAAQDPATDALFLAEVFADGRLRVDSVSAGFLQEAGT